MTKWQIPFFLLFAWVENLIEFDKCEYEVIHENYDHYDPLSWRIWNSSPDSPMDRNVIGHKNWVFAW
jgi:hypothetical protein